MNGARGQQRIGLLLVVLAALLASAQLWNGPGIHNTRAGGDSPFLLQRTFELAQGLRQAEFPVRWMGGAAHGLGYPFFHFYAALPYYLAAVLHLLGFGIPTAIKITQTLGMVLAGLAMSLFARLSVGPRHAWLAGMAYVLAPFHLVNVYVRGDALSEFWAFVFYPLILHCVWRITARDASALRHWSGLLGLSLACLVITHNVSAMIFSPFVLVLSIARLSHNWRPLSLVALAAGAGLGLALSAWFWLPALTSVGMVQLENQTTGFLNFANHFRLINLVQPSVLFDYTSDTSAAFALGLVQALLIAAGALAGLIWRTGWRSHVAFLLCFTLALFFITPYSTELWQALAPLQLAQFPWRFLSIAGFFGALLIARMASITNLYRVGIPLTATLLASALFGLPTARLEITSDDVNRDNLRVFEWVSGNIGSTIRAEYLPRQVRPEPRVGPWLFDEADRALAVASGDSGNRIAQAGARQTWQFEVAPDSDGVFVLPVLWWPDWRASNGQIEPELLPAHGSGWLQITLPPGAHLVNLWQTRALLTQLGEVLSLTAFLLTLIGLLRFSFTRRAVIAGLSLLAALFLCVAIDRGSTTSRPLLQSVDFGARPFPNRGPISWRDDTGRTFVLEGLTFSAATATPGQSIQVVPLWRAGIAPASFALRQYTPGGDMNLSDTARRIVRDAGAAQVISGAATFAIANGALPGPMLLEALVIDGGRSLTPTATDGTNVFALRLIGPTVQVGPVSASVLTGPVLRRMPPIAELVDFTWVDVDQEHICISATWQIARRVPDNLQLSIRVRGADGAEVVRVDAMPQMGQLPTWSWPVNGLINDGYCDARKTRPFEPEEPLEIDLIWYPAIDGRPLASTTLRSTAGSGRNRTR